MDELYTFYRDYRGFLAGLADGVWIVGTVQIWRMTGTAPEHLRGAYRLMGIYAVVLAIVFTVLLLRYVMPLK